MPDDHAMPLALLCPHCRYDITQTMRDGIDRCPECGEPIIERFCIPVYPRDPAAVRALCIGLFALGAITMSAGFIGVWIGAPVSPVTIACFPLAGLMLFLEVRIRTPIPWSPGVPQSRLECFYGDAALAVFIAVMLSTTLHAWLG